jgi:acetylornithine deacetylase
MTADDELVGLAERLTRIPSHDDPAAAGDAIEDWLRDETDATVVRDGVGNVLAWRGDAATGDDGDGSGDGDGDGIPLGGGGTELALVGHHDVVPPDENRVDADGGYRVERHSGRLHGRGAADMKGALAAAMLAFRDADPGGRIAFASFVGEEQGGVGARRAIDAGFGPERAVVLEGSTGYSAPGVVDVAVAHKGRRELAVTAEGRAAHASEPEEGVNAVELASDAVAAVRDLIPPETTVAGHRMRGSTCVTAIAGGEARNVVPSECTFTVDERTVPDGRVDLAPLRGIDGLTVEVAQDLPPMLCGDDEFQAAALDAAQDVQARGGGDGPHARVKDEGVGIEDEDAAVEGEDTAVEAPERVVKPHATDAGWLDAAGTDCVVIGPAEPGEAHTATESVSLDALATCREVYSELLDGA